MQWTILTLFTALALVAPEEIAVKDDGEEVERDERPWEAHFSMVERSARTLVSAKPSWRSIALEHARVFHNPDNRTMPPISLGYVTPWNSRASCCVGNRVHRQP